MPNISSLTMPDGIVYAIKDSQARKGIEDIKRNGSIGSGSVKVYTVSGDDTIQTGLSATDFVGAALCYNNSVFQSILLVANLNENVSMFVIPLDATTTKPLQIQYNPTTGKLTNAS